MIENTTISNGIVWDRKLKCMYYIDTATYTIAAYDYDETSGEIRNKRKVVKVDKTLGEPDGMAIDEDGMLWVALYGGGKVAKWNPTDGKLHGFIEIPETKFITSCAFGGDDLSDLYITTASQGLNQQELKKQPYAGALLRIKVNTKGTKLWYFNEI